MRLASSVLFLFLAACGGGGSSPPDAGGDGDGDGDGDGYVTDRVGQITLLELDGGAIAFAALNDRAPLPQEQQLDAAGDCALYVNPDCGDCMPYPQPISAGTISLTGLSQAFVFSDGEFGYQPDPYPSQAELFADDAAITATAAGGDAPGFTVSAGGVEPLVADPGTIVLDDATDHELTWTAGSGDARIQLALRAGWHGAPYEMMLLCETADDGALTIPHALIAQLPDFGGPSLFPWPSDMTRFTRGVVATAAGPIELFVGWQRPVNWSHNYSE